MSKYIGKRVSYPCSNCGTQFTLNKKTKELPNGKVLCEKCSVKCRKCNYEQNWKESGLCRQCYVDQDSPDQQELEDRMWSDL
jgi:predicted nucleic acid-binding Zn ribbon protein